jgi:hypothetical protein
MRRAGLRRRIGSGVATAATARRMVQSTSAGAFNRRAASRPAAAPAF